MHKNTESPHSATIFRQAHTVSKTEIDALGHVNNKIYLEWMENIATAHAHEVGLDLETQRQHGVLLVARQHQLTYLLPCYECDKLTLTTWIGEQVGCCQRKRHYAFYRRDQKVFEGETLWASINAKTLRPTRLPKHYVEAYLTTQQGRE